MCQGSGFGHADDEIPGPACCRDRPDVRCDGKLVVVNRALVRRYTIMPVLDISEGSGLRTESSSLLEGKGSVRHLFVDQFVLLFVVMVAALPSITPKAIRCDNGPDFTSRYFRRGG
jgi:hypothetical protein